MSNSLDPDQARRFVGPDLGPNCLPRLSADDTVRQRLQQYFVCMKIEHRLFFFKLSCNLPFCICMSLEEIKEIN